MYVRESRREVRKAPDAKFNCEDALCLVVAQVSSPLARTKSAKAHRSRIPGLPNLVPLAPVDGIHQQAERSLGSISSDEHGDRVSNPVSVLCKQVELCYDAVLDSDPDCRE